MNTDNIKHSSDHKDHIHPISPGFLAGEIIMCLISFGGLFLNLLVFYILIVRIRILKIDALLSILITIFDITGIVGLLVRVIFKWYTDGETLPSEELYFCKATGTIIFGSTISSIDIVSILGLLRCLIIVYKRNISSILWASIIGIVIAFNWFGGGFFVWYFDEMSWGQFCKRSYYLLDQINFKESIVFQAIAAAKSVLMLLILCISYSLIFRFYRKYFDSMKTSSLSDQSLIIELNSQKSKTSAKLILLVVSYILTYGPKVYLFLANILNFHAKIPVLELVASVLFSLCAIVNASVILFIQEETKQEWQILTTLFTQRIKYNFKR